MKEISTTNKTIIKYAKSKGYLSPIWLLPNAKSNDVQRAFQELETFLNDSYVGGEILDVSLEDIEDFMWKLKKEFAYDGWEGIAPYLLSAAHQKKISIPGLNS